MIPAESVHVRDKFIEFEASCPTCGALAHWLQNSSPTRVLKTDFRIKCDECD